jgi:hypothetical protein
MAAVAVVFDGGSSVRRRSMASAMDYDERTRGRRKKDRQRNNQPARGEDKKAVQREDDKG